MLRAQVAAESAAESFNLRLGLQGPQFPFLTRKEKRKMSLSLSSSALVLLACLSLVDAVPHVNTKSIQLRARPSSDLQYAGLPFNETAAKRNVFYAFISYCGANEIRDWSCGDKCKLMSAFKPVVC